MISLPRRLARFHRVYTPALAGGTARRCVAGRLSFGLPDAGGKTCQGPTIMALRPFMCSQHPACASRAGRMEELNDTLRTGAGTGQFDAAQAAWMEIKATGAAPATHAANAWLAALVARSKHVEALRLLSSDIERGLEVDSATVALALDACRGAAEYKLAEQHWADLTPGVTLGAAAHKARLNVMADAKQWQKCVHGLEAVIGAGLADEEAFIITMRACVAAGVPHTAMTVYDGMVRRCKLLPTLATFEQLMEGAASDGDAELAHEVLAEMDEHAVFPSHSVLSKALIAAAGARKRELAMRRLEEMVEWGMVPTSTDFDTCAALAATDGDVDGVTQLEARAKDAGLAPTAAMMKAHVDALCNCGEVRESVELLQRWLTGGKRQLACGPALDSLIRHLEHRDLAYEGGNGRPGAVWEAACGLIDDATSGDSTTRVSVAADTWHRLVVGLASAGYVHDSAGVLDDFNAVLRACRQTLDLTLGETVLRLLGEAGVEPNGETVAILHKSADGGDGDGSLPDRRVVRRRLAKLTEEQLHDQLLGNGVDSTGTKEEMVRRLEDVFYARFQAAGVDDAEGSWASLADDSGWESDPPSDEEEEWDTEDVTDSADSESVWSSDELEETDDTEAGSVEMALDEEWEDDDEDTVSFSNVHTKAVRPRRP